MGYQVSARSLAPMRVGIDVGGTFTDAVLVDDTTGRMALTRALPTPGDLADGGLAAVEKVLAQAGGGAGEGGGGCFLVSFLSPAHERAARERLRASLPKVAISLSSEVAQEFREF